MENETNFDLNKALTLWRADAGMSPAFTSENLRELETHLMESIGKLQCVGLSMEESFEIASRRLGGVAALGQELEKNNARRVWLDRMIWMEGGVKVGRGAG